MKIASASVAALLFSLTTVQAQAIRWKPEMLMPGDFVVLEQSQGPLLHHVFRGRSGNTFILETFHGPNANGQPNTITYLDRNGNRLRVVGSDGSSVTYDPHDCARTLGQCRFTKTDADGMTKEHLRRTQQRKHGFSFTLYDAGTALLQEGAFNLSSRGFAVNGWIKDTAGWDLPPNQIILFDLV